MKIAFRDRANDICVDIFGKLDSSTGPEIEAALNKLLTKNIDIVLNFKNVEYVSSGGLRVLLSIQKELSKNKHNLIVENPNKVVSEVLDTTGFSSLIEVR